MTAYHVLGKLASGGNATVYVARAEGALGVARTVALKKPHPHLLDDPEFDAAFRREATIAARLHHPNVTAVYDVVVHEGVPCLVMELVDGVTFSDLIRSWSKEGGQGSLGAALGVVVDAARGLHAVHELRSEDEQPMGLVHRDVSPQNVLVDRGGVAKLADFGLAKALLQGGESSTTEGILKGKIGYLAPEYIRGEPLDRRADIFALGIMLWEAITRRRLFRAEREPDVLSKILTMPIPEVSSDAAALPLNDLDAILERCLARKPGDRFASAIAVADALVAFADARGIDIGASAVAASFPDSLRDALDARSKSFRVPASVAGTAAPAGAEAEQTQKLAAALVLDDRTTRRDVAAGTGPAHRLRAGIGALLVLSILGAGGWLLSAAWRPSGAAATPERLAAPLTSESSVPSAREVLPADTQGTEADGPGPRSTSHPGRPAGLPKASGPKGSPSAPAPAPSSGPRPNPYGAPSR